MQYDRCTRARGVKPELPQLRVEKPAETLEGMVLFGLGDDGAPAPLSPEIGGPTVDFRPS